jgi:hypothetical protein
MSTINQKQLAAKLRAYCKAAGGVRQAAECLGCTGAYLRAIMSLGTTASEKVCAALGYRAIKTISYRYEERKNRLAVGVGDTHKHDALSSDKGQAV